MHRGSPVGIAAVGAVAGTGGIVGHFWHTIPKEKLGEVSELIHSGEAALVVVAVNHNGTDITPLLENAKGKTVVETTAGDLDATFDNALKKALMFAGLFLVCFFPFLAVVDAATGRNTQQTITDRLGLNAQASHDVDALISAGNQTVSALSVLGAIVLVLHPQADLARRISRLYLA
jgi:hypothetical protein